MCFTPPSFPARPDADPPPAWFLFCATWNRPSSNRQTLTGLVEGRRQSPFKAVVARLKSPFQGYLLETGRRGVIKAAPAARINGCVAFRVAEDAQLARASPPRAVAPNAADRNPG
jgi:hypothetical protein